MRDVSVKIARNVIQQAVKEGLSQEKEIPTDDEELEEWIREQMWSAEYRPLKLVEKDNATPFARGEVGTASHRREGTSRSS